ncbi:hypothetical protein Pyn_08525 [Prunus yedoensis var. nudiflora]|uniref:TNase-like domain-containing protein n=1 Tax=Prunus yedoensis var. nudiflora TaxID=2094558 RepID=A0A314YWH2_PRUYE|nr:hypothetical protein Pyn_08525 [Prunus yedoensis var. nudiflora]
MDTIDLSNATHKEARRACNSIFVCSFGKYKKVHAFVEFVTRINNRDKIILRIQNQKIWRIAFSLHGLTWPKDEEPYADEAIELLRTTISQRWVEVELETMETIDKDGHFVGYLLESNTHVIIPVLEAGLAKLTNVWPENYTFKAEEYAREKKLKIWEN